MSRRDRPQDTAGEQRVECERLSYDASNRYLRELWSTVGDGRRRGWRIVGVTNLPHLQGGVIRRDGEYRGFLPSPEGEEDPGRHSHRAGGLGRPRPGGGPPANEVESGLGERWLDAFVRIEDPTAAGDVTGRRPHPPEGGLVAFPQGSLAPQARAGSDPRQVAKRLA